MIERYLYNIQRLVPEENKYRAVSETKDKLEAYLVEHYGNKEYSKSEILEALRSVGHPRMIALEYGAVSNRWIGPLYMDSYLEVCKVVLICILFGVTLGQLVTQKEGWGTIISSILINVIQAGVVSVAVITIVYVILSNIKSEEEEERQKWSMDILKASPRERNKVSITEIAFESLAIVLALIWINYPESLIQIVSNFNAADHIYMPLFNKAAFQEFAIIMNIVLSLNLVLNGYLFANKEWNPTTRIGSMALDCVGFFLLVRILQTPNLIQWEVPAKIFEKIDWGAYVILGIVGISILGELIGHAKAMFFSK